LDGTHSLVQGFMARCTVHRNALYRSVRAGLLHLLTASREGSPCLGWWLMVICPVCGGEMRIKASRYVSFFGCTEYGCNETMKISEGTKQAKENREKLEKV